MVKVTGSHSGPLNVKVAFALNGVADGDASDIVNLMRSGEPIDPQTREAIADAFERRSGVRLEFRRGNQATYIDHLATEKHYQAIADSFARRLNSGEVEKNARVDTQKEFGISPRTLETALKRRRNARFRVEYLPDGGDSQT